MRWFKHYTDNHRGRSIQELLDKLGHTGPCCYYLLMEICAEKIEKTENPLNENDCIFTFNTRIIRQNLRISLTNLRHFLDICHGFGLLSYEFSGNSVQISMPILLNLLEKNIKKVPRKVLKSSQKVPLDKDKDKDKEYNIINDIIVGSDREKTLSKPTSSKNSNFFKFKITDSFSVELPEQLAKSWAETYPKDFIEEDLSKARNWLIANEHKWPKKHWHNFFNAWLARSWERYRVSLKSNPPKVSFEQLVNILEG